MIYNAPVKDMMFLVNDWLGLDRVTALPGYEEVDADLFEAVLEEAGKFASTELLPINAAGDEHGVMFENGTVSTPPGFKAAYDQFVGNGWLGIDANPDYGGQGLPRLLQYLTDEIIGGANIAFKLYPELSHAAYHLLEEVASDDIRQRYLPKMVAGEWSGTMCLTEPHCGTDLGLLSTKATPQDDGSYKLTGAKIFITSGDHDLTENILHLVIARIDGAPTGTRGISLFLVPKYLVNDDGTVGAFNNVNTASIEHKMGIRGSATVALNFDNATGYLLGKENRGLAAMFKMMNNERLSVGIQGLGCAEIAYQNALAYAQERRQSKAPPPRPDDSKAADPIVYQPEIKRLLLRIRSQVEGARALAVLTALHVDTVDKAADEAARAEAGHLVALLTPVIKAHFSDLGVESAIAAQQVYGGHGYIREHGMEQLVRDARIAQIYEGTNEVQALDLVARKLTGATGEFADRFLAEHKAALTELLGDDELAGLAQAALDAHARLVEATARVREQLARDFGAAQGAATAYLRLFGLTVIGCLWARIVGSIRGKEGDFYDTKRKLAHFYMQQVLPETLGLAATITSGSAALAGFDVADFGA